MLQQVMTNPGEIIFREVPVPEVKENQVLVKDYEYWYLWIRYSCLSWKTSVYKISGNTGT